MTDDALWRLRWPMLASETVGAAALVFIVVTHRAGWRWPLFVWAVVIGLVGFAVTLTVFGIATRRPNMPESARLRFRRRRWIYGSGWVYGGVLMGLVAGAFNVPWLDIGLTIYLGLCAVAFGVILTLIRSGRVHPRWSA